MRNFVTAGRDWGRRAPGRARGTTARPGCAARGSIDVRIAPRVRVILAPTISYV